MDNSTQQTDRGQFAKAVVELDLSKPLETETCIDGTWYTILYESLPNVCFGCGRIGHNLAVCPAKNVVSTPVAATDSSGGAYSVKWGIYCCTWGAGKWELDLWHYWCGGQY
ncbi:hypothetical protein Tsubulata_048159 [Turnera subulata]|uniref:Zinc knuckle CX2CX4HX4C domain-containing protein n=1 Tax=Turnera subulata TaxID=218843 RepID=A0A9Q0G648_9ROSI|nr:hypothetical protein Tsubulata_048159 [Turnera subulata]